MDFELILYGGRQIRTFIDEHMIAAAMGIALEQQSGLVDPVDDPVGRDMARAPPAWRMWSGRFNDDAPTIRPGSITPGHRAAAGTRAPPSVKSPLPPRNRPSPRPAPGGGYA